MDAVKFLKEAERLCKSFKCCENCPLNDSGCCVSNEIKSVPIVENWSAEHPNKIRLQDFLEKYPNAELQNDGIPQACCKFLGYCNKCVGTNCRECWNTPID